MSNNILEVKNFSVSYNVKVKDKGSFFAKIKHLKAVNNVSFNLQHGEILGIVGESGCGKSTLVKALLKLLHANIDGEVIYNNVNINNLTEKNIKNIRKDIQIIFQDPLASLNPKMLIKDIIAEPLTVYYPNLTKKQQLEKVYNIMQKVGLKKEFANRYPHEFSGGQCQRIGIARAMILEPKILVCDEAVSALDVSIQAQIINLIKHLKEEYNMSVIFISHDLSVIKYISDRILVFYLGSLVEEGNAEDLYKNAMHPYTNALISAIPEIEDINKKRLVIQGEIPSPLNLPEGCSFFSRCQNKKDECKKIKPLFRNMGYNHNVACINPVKTN